VSLELSVGQKLEYCRFGVEREKTRNARSVEPIRTSGGCAPDNIKKSSWHGAVFRGWMTR